MEDKKPSEPVAEALRAEILKLATVGDTKKDGALTAEVLLRIMRVAKTGRDVLVSLDASPANLTAMLKKPRSPWAIPVLGEDIPDDSLGETGSPFAPSPPAENFGMTVMREIIAAAKNLNGGGNNPSRLVEALAIAREKGLDDVARELEKQLGVGKDKAAVEASPVGTKEDK